MPGSIKPVLRRLDDLASRALTWENMVSEDRLHQIANALWVLSSFLTMRGNSAVTRLAQGCTESTGGKGIRASEGRDRTSGWLAERS